MNPVTASVVLYKTPENQLTRLLDCIAASSVSVHTYLVDHSPDHAELSCFHRSDVTYIRSPENRGYGAGHNIALRQVLDRSEFHFVLNPDIYFEPEALKVMLEFMRREASIGQLMPRVTYPDGRLQYLCKLLPTPADLFLRRFAFGPLKKVQHTRVEQFELRFTCYRTLMDVPYLSGCFMLFRVSALRQVGLFDERFFMYPEDMDMTRRMHAEFRTVFYPEATIVHDHARESYKSTRALRIHITNMIRYFNKWGWFRDSQRRQFNQETLLRLQAAVEADAHRLERTSNGAMSV